MIGSHLSTPFSTSEVTVEFLNRRVQLLARRMSETVIEINTKEPIPPGYELRLFRAEGLGEVFELHEDVQPPYNDSVLANVDYKYYAQIYREGVRAPQSNLCVVKSPINVMQGGAKPINFTDSGLININVATLSQLDTLPNIGPVLAQAIIDYRTQSGPFEVIEDIMNVPGIGEATFNAIENLITVQ